MSTESTEVGCCFVFNNWSCVGWYHTGLTSLCVVSPWCCSSKSGRATQLLLIILVSLLPDSSWRLAEPLYVPAAWRCDQAQTERNTQNSGVIAPPGSLLCSGCSPTVALPLLPSLLPWPGPVFVTPGLLSGVAQLVLTTLHLPTSLPPAFHWLYLTMSSLCISRLFCCRGRWSNSL